MKNSVIRAFWFPAFRKRPFGIRSGHCRGFFTPLEVKPQQRCAVACADRALVAEIDFQSALFVRSAVAGRVDAGKPVDVDITLGARGLGGADGADAQGIGRQWPSGHGNDDRRRLGGLRSLAAVAGRKSTPFRGADGADALQRLRQHWSKATRRASNAWHLPAASSVGARCGDAQLRALALALRRDAHFVAAFPEGCDEALFGGNEFSSSQSKTARFVNTYRWEGLKQIDRDRFISAECDLTEDVSK